MFPLLQHRTWGQRTTTIWPVRSGIIEQEKRIERPSYWLWFSYALGGHGGRPRECLRLPTAAVGYDFIVPNETPCTCMMDFIVSMLGTFYGPFHSQLSPEWWRVPCVFAGLVQVCDGFLDCFTHRT